MLKKMITDIALLLGLMVVNMVVACHSGGRTTVDGIWITIKSGGHHIEEILQTPSTYQFLMKDKGVSIGTFSFEPRGSAMSSKIYFSKVMKKKKGYIDCKKCQTIYQGLIKREKTEMGV